MRLIDADALIEAFSDFLTDGYVATYGAVESRIELAPTIDAVPVVRCEECIFSQEEEDSTFGKFMSCNLWGGQGTIGFGFCSKGKKAGDAE